MLTSFIELNLAIRTRLLELKACGANKPGGGGFVAGNTCARGGSSVSGSDLDSATERYFDFDHASAVRAASRGENLGNFHTTGGEKLTDAEISLAKSDAKILQEAAQTTNSGEKIVYRGTTTPDEKSFESSFKVNKTYEFDALSSASPNAKIAKIYSDNQYSGGFGISVLLHIENKNGVVGTVRDKGGEVILPKGAKYRVTRTWKDNNGMHHATLYSTVKLGKASK